MRHLVRKYKTEENKLKHQSMLFCSNVLRKINKYRQQSELCDVVLEVGSREFQAHRAVLSASCAFFEGLFSSEMKEKKQDRIKLEELEESVMEDLLNYLYTGEVNLTEDNARELLQAADFLLLTRLKEMAACFIESEMNLMNCVSVFQFADMFNCTDLKTEAMRLIHTHFEELSRTDDFYKLNTAQIREVISSENLVAEKEEFVFETLMRWVEEDVRREKDLFDLCLHIDLNLMESSYVHTQLAKNDMLKRNAELADLIKSFTGLELDNIPQQGKRKCVSKTNKEQGFFVEIEGHDQLVYMAEQNKWFNNMFLDVEISDAAKVLCHEDKIYILSEYSDIFECYCVTNNSFTELAPPPHSVSDYGAIVLNACVYLVGGQDCRSTASVQMYDPDIGVWSEKSPMNVARSCHTVVTDGCCLFAIGGCNEDCNALDSVECYNSSTNTWTLLSPMGAGRVLAEAVAIDGYLLVLEGADGHFNNVGSWLIHSNSDGTWYEVSDQGVQLQERGFTVLRVKRFGDQIYLFCWIKNSREFCFVYTSGTSPDWKISKSVGLSPMEFVTLHGGAIHFSREMQQLWSALQ